jgi:hypothetical protein
VPERRDRAVEVVQLLTRCHRLRLGRGPVAAKAEDLCTVDAARAREAETSSLSQKRLAASVHSAARRKSPRSWQELIVMQ